MSFSVTIVPVTPFVQNCSIIMCLETQRAAIVDPGGEPDKILAQLTQLGATAEKIFLTHAHIDHAGAAATLAKQLNLSIEGPHQDDLFWIEGLPQQAAMFSFPKAEAFVPTRWLQEGDRVQVGNVELDVLHCPGHTPGHLVFYSSAQQLAFVGDVIFQGSIGRTDFPQGNHAQLVASIREKLFPLGDEVKFIPGHGPQSTFGHERRTNPFVADRRGLRKIIR